MAGIYSLGYSPVRTNRKVARGLYTILRKRNPLNYEEWIQEPLETTLEQDIRIDADAISIRSAGDVGLRLECRTSDYISAPAGQIWLRTDLT